MKDISFRYWDPFNEVMIYNHQFQMLSDFFEEHDKALYAGNNPALMQYTGLKDKNGREIFEGDILFTYHNEHYPELTGNVTFEDGRFMCWFKFKNGGAVGYPGESLKSCKVIGNIYETAETEEN